MCRWEMCTETGEHKIKCLVNCFFSLWYSNFSSTLFLLSPNLSFPLITVLPGHLMSLFRACLAISSLNLHILCSCFPSIFPVFIFLGCAGSDYLSKVDLNLFVLYLTYLRNKFYSKEIFPQYFFQFFIIPNYWCCESMFTHYCGPWVTVKKNLFSQNVPQSNIVLIIICCIIPIFECGILGTEKIYMLLFLTMLRRVLLKVYILSSKKIRLLPQLFAV